MKTFKRFSAILLAVLLLVSMMVVPASAAGEGSIQINNTAVNTTYKLYKVFNIENNGGSYYYKPANDSWKAFFTKTTSGTSPNGTLYGTVTANGYIVWLNQSLFAGGDIGNIAGAAFAKHAQEYAAALPADVTISSTSTSLTITGLDQNAYYLVVSSLGGTVMAGPIGNTALEIIEKNDVGLAPTIVKSVGPADAEYMSVDMGQPFPFKIVATLNEAIPSETTVTITDIIPKHITLDDSSVVVKKNGSVLTKNTDYTFAHADGTDTYTHTFTFTSGFNAGDALTITYNGTLVPVGSTLPTSHEMYTNRATLSYGSKSVFDTAAVFTLAVNGYKYYVSDTGVETDLDEAQFVLKNSAGKYYNLSASNVVTWVDTQGEATIATSDGNGEFSFLGIAMGEYTLVEAAAPSGFTKADDIALTVNRDFGEVRVENVKGTGLLPETGGIGTPIFYGIGGVLIIGALSLLIVRKRTTAK